MTMNNRRTLLILLLVSLLTLSSCGVEKNHDDTLTSRLNGRTGYRESICDIPCQIEEIYCNKSIEGLMRDETTGEFFVVVKSIDEDSNCFRLLYRILPDGSDYSAIQIDLDNNGLEQYVYLDGRIICISSEETVFLSVEDGSILSVAQNDHNPLSSCKLGNDYVVTYSDHIVLYNNSGEELSRVSIDNTLYSSYFDPLFEQDGTFYLVSCSGYEYDYYAIDFNSGYCNFLFNNYDLGIDFEDCNGQYVFNEIGEFRVDPCSESLVLLAEWNNTNSRPGGYPNMGYRYYYTFGDDLFVKAYVDSDNTTSIQIYEYDDSIDYSNSKIITVGGIGMEQDVAFNLAVYNYNISQDEYRVNLIEFENEAESNVDELERNSRLIVDFNNGNAPDIFYGNNFDYDYFGRSGIVLDLLPYLVDNEYINLDDIEDSLRNTMISDDHCYYLYDAFVFNGFWGRYDSMSQMTDMTYDQMFELDNPDGQILSTYYARDIAGFIISYAFSHFIDTNCDLLFTESQLEDVIALSLEYGLPNSSSFEMLGEDGFDHIRTNEYLMTWSIVPNLFWFDSAVKESGGDICYLGFPSFFGATHVIQPQGNVAVSSSTEYPDACISFISYLFSDDIQRRIISSGSNSVMHSVNEELFVYAQNPEMIPDERAAYRHIFSNRDPISQNVIESYRNAITSVDSVQIYDWSVYEMINEEITTYDSQGRSPEMIADSLYSRLELYAHEYYG